MSTTKIQHTDFELEQYVQELYHEVNSLAYSDDGGASKEDKFTEYVMETLAEAGETEGQRLCSFIKENRFENIDLKINGYAIEDGFESIDLFISQFVDINSIFSLKKPEFDNLLKWSIKFLNAAIKGHLEDIEESSEAYGLANIVSEKCRDLIRVNIFILSNGNIPFDAPKKTEVKGFEELLINVHIWDIERLHRLSQSKYNREPIEINFSETLGVTIPCLAMPSKKELYECYLAIVPGAMLATLYKNYGTRLLESNVRAFLQQTGKVNKGIRDTIRNEPTMFLPYNNGLASTAMDVRTEHDKNGQLVITGVKDFQIVNGGQTTASLFHTLKKYKSDLSDVFVQMKLTVIKDEDKKNEIVPFISRYANSQTKVSELDLTSNNVFLIRLEELSRLTYATDKDDKNKQTIWFFERVAGQYREALNKEPTKGKQAAFKLKFPSQQKVIKSEVAKYMNVYLRMPYHVSKGAQKNYNFYLKEAEKEYKKKKPSRVLWEDIIANAILFKATDQLFGRKNQDPIGDTNIKSHTVAYALSLFHHVTEGRVNLKQIWDRQIIDDELLRELKKGLVYVYKFLTNLDAMLISEAAKAEKTWNRLKEYTDYPFDKVVLDKFCISESDRKKRYEESEDDVDELKSYHYLEKITKLGLLFWDGLSRYLINYRILSPQKINFVDHIKKNLKEGKTLSGVQIRNGIEIIELVKETGVSFEEIAALSSLKDNDILDPSIIISRVMKLSTDQWNSIIALGEQTGTFTFNDISVIRSVRSKVSRKEEVDLRRLQIIDKALDKLKKFKVEYD